MNTKSLIISSIIACASLGVSALNAACTIPAPTDTAVKEINTFFEEPALKEALEKFSFSTTVGYESEYVFRGRNITGPSINPAANIGYEIGEGFAAAVGYWGNYNVSDSASSCSENDFTVGLSYSIENVNLELGYVAYTYSAGGNTNEFKVGASYDTSELLGDYNVSPYVAGYYDITLSCKTLEGGLSYSAPVTKWLLDSNWGTIDFAGYVGYTYGNISVNDAGDSYYDGYFYSGISIGATIAITDNCSYSAGMRYAYCNDYEAFGPTNSRLWFGTSITFGF